MRATIFFSLLCFVLLFASMRPHPKPDYTGTWILNLEKSTLQSEKNGEITGGTFIITQKDDKFSLTRYHEYGSKKKKISFRMTADGQTRKIKILFNGKLQWMSDSLEAIIWNKGFTNKVHYKFGSSPDELIADENFSSSKINYHNYWVFDKKN